MDYITYQYPKFQKTVYMIFFVAFFLASTIAIFLPTLALLGVIEGEANLSAMPVGMLVGSMLIFVGIYLNMFMPDVRVRENGFQLKTIFYESQWLRWEEIISVNKHPLSMRNYEWHGIRIENIHPIYSFIGTNQRIGGKGFLLTEKIQGYDDLIRVLKTKRPDLF